MKSRGNTVSAWLVAPLSAVALLTLGACLDQPRHEEGATAASVSDAVTQARIAHQRDALAQKLCEVERGPGAQVIWTHDGDLVCRVHTQVAKGGAL